MLGDSSIRVKLSVWRDLVPNKALILRRGAETDQQVLSADNNLQQEVYSWPMREDPFGGIYDSGLRERLRELLVDRFDATRPPAERRFSASSSPSLARGTVLAAAL